ncbi:hypothetical protein [Nonomuraea jabiensis]|uniref:hypothetical protein n=1 Tax=Nonomuraea jabiensis TaxID=882448 RepID=UPI0036B3083D
MRPADARYELYGLEGNPYAVGPLDAVTCESDRELLLELAGIRLSAIEAAIERAVSRNRPAFFLITGVGKSGRTSLANHVMRLYQDATAQPGRTFVTHCAEPEHMTHDAYTQMCSTLLGLRNMMNDCAINVPDELRARFSELGRRTSTDPMNEYDLQDIAWSSGATFAAANVGFGVRYESVPTKKLIWLATKVFERTSTVVVFVVDAYDHANTAQLTVADRERFATRGHIVDLGTLPPVQIAELAHRRWSGRPPPPFHAEGLMEALGGRTYTVGQAMRRLALLLEFRLREYEKDDPWPTDDLRMPGDWLHLRIWQGESWNGLGGTHG